MRVLRLGLAAAAVAMTVGCASPRHEPTQFGSLPGWGGDSYAAALPAIAESCQAFDRMPDDKAVVYPGFQGTAADWRPICRDLPLVPAGDDDEARAFFERWFTPVSVADPEADDHRTGLFTGYYIPDLDGSWTRTERFRVPVYARPPAGLADFDRAGIEGGLLSGQGLEILWVDDPVDLFFMQIQGSGRVLMPDGSTVMLGYAGSNGRPYFAIGRALVDWGYATREEMSMQFIRAWLEAKPHRAKGLMDLNESYVYFQVLDGPALGSLGRPLTPGRSLAIDKRMWSLGYPFWVEIEGTATEEAPWSQERMRRLMVAQDTGGAIRGPVRGDVFWGYGPLAGALAGSMRAQGRYWALVPSAAVARGAEAEAV